MSPLKKLLFLPLFLVCFPLLAEVEMSIDSHLVLQANDADASSYYKMTDANDKVCALLKVHPSNPLTAMLVLDTGAGAATVKMQKQATGEWWYWLSPDTKNIFFAAEGYKRTAPLGVSLQPGKVYTLNLTVGAAIMTVQQYNLQRYVMKLNITPKDCIVSYGKDTQYDMGREVVRDGYFEAVLNEGSYYYKIENAYYRTFEGIYQLNANAREESVSMSPAYGYLSLSSEPSGAEVYLDDSMQPVGKTPLKTSMLKTGPHRVTLLKENYYSNSLEVDVPSDGSARDVKTIVLRPQFGTVLCLCEDTNADLTVYDAADKVIAKGKSGMSVQLNSKGGYKLEASKSSHKSQSVGIQGGPDLEGKKITVSVGVPVPLYGGLQISSEPRKAEVWIDGEYVGTTTYIGRVLMGEHRVELRMEGYPKQSPFTVSISEGQETVVSKKLEIATVLGGGALGAAGGVSASLGGSSSPTANCYIVSKPGTYSFPTVKGNSTDSVGDVARAEVLWESFGTATAPKNGDIIAKVSYDSSADVITYSTPVTLKNGNAVIAAKDASGTILWSWHIWVCSGYNPSSTAQTYYNSAGKMMDRNLGATSASVGNVGSLGLLYQWGRKDPFLGGCHISYSSLIDPQKAASTLSWPSAVSSNSSNGTITYTIKKPTTFIKCNESNYDWYYTGSSSTDNTRWQTTKTIYDPCPPGWKVPAGDDSGVWSKAVGSSSSFSYTWDSTNKGMDFYGKFGSASTIWYPAAGGLYGDGSLYTVGHYGYWWSCTPSDYDAYALQLKSNGDVFPLGFYSRAYGFSVRCQKE